MRVSSYWPTELQHINLIIIFHLDNNQFSSSLLDRNYSFWNPTQNTIAIIFLAWSSDAKDQTLFGHVSGLPFSTVSEFWFHNYHSHFSSPVTTYQPILTSMLLTLSALNVFYWLFLTTSFVSNGTYQSSLIERANREVTEKECSKSSAVWAGKNVLSTPVPLLAVHFHYNSC